ncbi:MAG: T9SS type A sorting domain-containing protein, partial [Saprospiraceae bacterium]|nr:T9SS type A sorting domain-containing protein [Saprospiraceae bacterium]
TQQTTITLANLGDKQNRFLECIPGGHCFFGVQYDSVVQVWRTNGSPSGTMPLGFFDMQQSFSRYAAWKNKMLIMDDFDFDNPKPVIISNGTTAGTYYLDSTLLALTGMTKIYCCNATPDKLIFSGRWTNPNGTHNGRAYISDGTPEGTKMLDAFGYFRTVVKMDSLYFLRSVNDMYVYDAVADTTILLINNGCNGFGQVITHNNKAYIPGDEGQIYESDGTVAGTHIISTQGAGLNNYSVYLWVFDHYLYYNFRDSEHGIGLNRINLNTGVESLVVKVMDYSGAIMIPLMEKVGNRLIFPKWTSLQGLEMWGSNGPLTEIASPEVKPLSISPNPVADRLHILESERIGEAHFQIVDNIGKVVKTGVLQPENDLMVQDLTPGVYFLQLISRRDKHVSLAKFVKI